MSPKEIGMRICCRRRITPLIPTPDEDTLLEGRPLPRLRDPFLVQTGPDRAGPSIEKSKSIGRLISLRFPYGFICSRHSVARSPLRQTALFARPFLLTQDPMKIPRLHRAVRSFARLCSIVSAALLLTLTPVAWAQGTGTITGRVLNESTGQYLRN